VNKSRVERSSDPVSRRFGVKDCIRRCDASTAASDTANHDVKRRPLDAGLFARRGFRGAQRSRPGHRPGAIRENNATVWQVRSQGLEVSERRLCVYRG
jgi:hypothetical protein